jgi:hypothetical protein
MRVEMLSARAGVGDGGGVPVTLTVKLPINQTTITLGCNNVFSHDPPDASTSTNYADFSYDSTGRFVYIIVSKEFYRRDQHARRPRLTRHPEEVLSDSVKGAI